MTEEKIFRSPRKRGRVAVLLSGRGSNFRAIHDAMAEGKINGGVVAVVSNRAEAPGLQTARERGLEALYLDPKAYASKEAYDVAIVEELQKRAVDLVCLAGYMKIVTPLFCQAFRNQIMNIHPALLPSFPDFMLKNRLLIMAFATRGRRFISSPKKWMAGRLFSSRSCPFTRMTPKRLWLTESWSGNIKSIPRRCAFTLRESSR